MNRYSLNDYYKWSLESNSLVLVKERNEEIFAVSYLTIHDSYITIEMFSRNSLVDSKGIGANMLRVIFEYICKPNEIYEVRLEAIKNAVSYYDSYLPIELQFTEYDEPFPGEGWGVLTPKKKILSR
jgi:hypothetical protein